MFQWTVPTCQRITKYFLREKNLDLALSEQTNCQFQKRLNFKNLISIDCFESSEDGGSDRRVLVDCGFVGGSPEVWRIVVFVKNDH